MNNLQSDASLGCSAAGMVSTPSTMITFGPHECSDLDRSAEREWLVTDALGGYAMGTVSGLRTRRYHGLLVVAADSGASRQLGLAALDPVLVVNGQRIRLATHEWANGSIDPHGHELLARFDLLDGVPRWTWSVGATVVQREIAMDHGHATVAVTHRLLASNGPVRLELTPLCTWRNAHGERHANGEPAVEHHSWGFHFESAYRVFGAGWIPGGQWYRGAHLREEAARGLSATEDLWAAGAFELDLDIGESHLLTATADRANPAYTADDIVRRARSRARGLVATAEATDAETSLLVLAADQFITNVDGVPGVIAGYPWFGAWSRDTMTAYDGLFICTRRFDEGRSLLIRAAKTVSEGMLANTADTGMLEYNTADASLWFLHAVGRHLATTDDDSLAVSVVDAVDEIIERHIAGTRYGIGMDPFDSLLMQGADGVALTWMDARIDGQAVTPRSGKPVEINALWINGLRVVADLHRRTGRPTQWLYDLADAASLSFTERFVRPDGLGLFDVVDGVHVDWSIRPNQLLAASLPHGPGAPRSAVEVCRDHLLTPIGMRSLSPDDDSYVGVHRGGPHERDAAYHQGTVWPWLVGSYVDAALKNGVPVDGLDEVDGLGLHLREWGLGSVSETADGDAPHRATGCPFQAWSVAEALRIQRRTR